MTSNDVHTNWSANEIETLETQRIESQFHQEVERIQRTHGRTDVPPVWRTDPRMEERRDSWRKPGIVKTQTILLIYTA